jgi:hypothetical protein
MALTQLKTQRLRGTDAGNLIDDKLRDLEAALVAILGYTPDVDIAAAAFACAQDGTHFDVAGHLLIGGDAPAIAAGSGAGTSPTLSVGGNDAIGGISLVAGTTPSASATVLTVTFDVPYAHPARVILVPTNANAAALTGNAQVYVDDSTSNILTAFDLKVGSTALVAGVGYHWSYHVIGRA